ncbi:MAG: CHC2 zinc finger domain-containing protein [Bacteroidota bacterium]|nr:CHC2 zinc finger domain-containing protein [Bacteroidota bacterium]
MKPYIIANKKIIFNNITKAFCRHLPDGYVCRHMSDLVKIVSKHITLREGRKTLKGNCPFHPDQSDSFMVSPEKNLFKCFGCGKEGGPVEFVMWIENTNFGTAPKRE